MFLASPIVQTIVNDIYSGLIIFTNKSNRSLLADNYKHRDIEIYDGRTAGFLDHYRREAPSVLPDNRSDVKTGYEYQSTVQFSNS